ncbi:hypothetical protein Lspi_0521 [Legionella spiritensis]|uniref:Glycosyltransferase RgtA/B/C/D-like domain-containing protein n=2 Tax=Legionella spiritensis TaxID=452 RepID=A0A0W0Z9P3_LEGSP|nr:hypothetical protein Lspi_0521 [Legionella spiritensis]SNV41198.1 Uncharacterised protein [Legionella spiritensis]
MPTGTMNTKSWFTRTATKLTTPGILLALVSVTMMLIRLFARNPVLTLDEAEQMVLARHLQFGYPGQPPLYSWLQYVLFQLFGYHLFSLALLKYLLLYGCLYFYHQINRLYCRNERMAWCATVAWALIPAIALDLMKDNTHSILALLAACMTWVWLNKPSTLPKPLWDLILGFLFAIGVLAKFNYLLFLLIVTISLFTQPDKNLKRAGTGILIGLTVTLILTSPYLWWLFEHVTLGLQHAYKLVPREKQQWQGLLELLKSVVYFAAPGLLVMRLFFPVRFQLSTPNPGNILLGNYLKLSVPVLSIVTVFFTFRDFETRWLIPILFLYPTFYFSQTRQRKDERKIAMRFIGLCLVIQLIYCIVLIHRDHTYRQINRQMTIAGLIKGVDKTCPSPAYLISDTYWLVGNLFLQYPDTTIILTTATPSDVHVQKGTKLLLWESRDTPDWVNRYVKKEGANTTVMSVYNPETTKVLAHYLCIPQAL